jgi:hypothetical protein
LQLVVTVKTSITNKKKENSMGRLTEYMEFLSATPKEFAKLNKQKGGQYFFYSYIEPSKQMMKTRSKLKLYKK